MILVGIMVSRCLSICVFICLSVHLAYVHPSVFSFPDDNLSKYGFSPNLVCALILWRLGLGLLRPYFFILKAYRRVLKKLLSGDRNKSKNVKKLRSMN